MSLLHSPGGSNLTTKDNSAFPFDSTITKKGLESRVGRVQKIKIKFCERKGSSLTKRSDERSAGGRGRGGHVMGKMADNTTV